MKSRVSKPTKMAIKAMKILGLNIHEVAGFYFAIGFSAGYDVAMKSHLKTLQKNPK